MERKTFWENKSDELRDMFAPKEFTKKELDAAVALAKEVWEKERGQAIKALEMIKGIMHNDIEEILGKDVSKLVDNALKNRK